MRTLHGTEGLAELDARGQDGACQQLLIMIDNIQLVHASQR